MQRHNLRLAIVSDRPNQGIAKTYLSLLHTENGIYAGAQWSPVAFDPAHQEPTAEALEKQHAALVRVGVPGRGDYSEVLYSFLEAYMGVKRKPLLGLITHDARHTRYMLEQWPAVLRLPDGAVSIIDASRSLSVRPSTLETALDLLLRKGNARVVPFNEVSPRSIRQSQEFDFVQAIQ